ncbi:MAG: hypothetical protein MJY99_09155 [Fibrobacter sp.]|nr:hypothetical protein [Fibrobacter sp.]
MTDEQFKELISAMKAQTKAIKEMTKIQMLQTALQISKTKTVTNAPLTESNGLNGALSNIERYMKSSKTPETWNEDAASEVFVKTFYSKPLKVDND